MAQGKRKTCQSDLTALQEPGVRVIVGMPEQTGERSHLELLAFRSGASEVMAYVPVCQDPGTSHRRLSGGCLLPEVNPIAPDHLGEWCSSVVMLTLGLLGDGTFTGFTQ